MSTDRHPAIRILTQVLCHCVLLVVPTIAIGSDGPVTGVMAFGWGQNFQMSPAVSLPYIDGFTAYFAWNDLEPTEGHYEFGSIDALLEHTAANGKTFNIGIYAGAHTPEWLYEKGIESFQWLRPLKEDQARQRGSAHEQRSPYPWDPKYLGHWKKFIAVLIRRYKDNQAVGYISLTGPTIRDLTTGILLKDDNDWNRFRGGMDITDKLVAAWIEVIEHYQSVDRNQRYALAIGPMRPGNPNVDVATQVSNYVLDHDYKNIAMMSVFLNDSWFNSGLAAKRIRSLLKVAREKEFNVGYQMAQSAQRNSTWTKNRPIVTSLARSFELGLGDGMQWVEIWHDDIIDRGIESPNQKYVEDILAVHHVLSRK